MSEIGEEEKAEKKYRRVHFLIREDLYEKLWKVTVDRYAIPTRKLHLIVNEALEQYINSYYTNKERGV